LISLSVMGKTELKQGEARMNAPTLSAPPLHE
jgi:hypothetical protein